MRFIAKLGALLLAAACGTTSRVEVPEGLSDVPGSSSLDLRCRAARELVDVGRDSEALAELEELLREDSVHVDALRVRQDVLRRRGRTGRCLWEAEQMLANHPDNPVAHYLAGRLLADDRDKLERFEQAVRLAPQWFWGWLGTAYALRALDPQRSLAIYRALYDRTGGHALVGVALALALRASSSVSARLDTPQDQPVTAIPVDPARDAEVLRIYEQLRRDQSQPGVGDLGIAETMALAGRREAWPALLRALQQRPFDPGARRLLRQYVASGLPTEQLLQVVDTLQQDPSRSAAFAAGEGAGVLAMVLNHAGLPYAALATLDADGTGPLDPELRREWLRLRLRTGDVSGFLAELRRAHPDASLLDNRNQVRGLWLTLFEGPWMKSRDPLADAGQAASLSEALLRAGMLEEAETVATVALLRHREDASGPLAKLQDEVRKELAFERALRRIVYAGYGSDGPIELNHVLSELRRVSREILGQDVVGEPARFHMPWIGDLLDPFGSGLCAHFARYNRYLVLGQRQGRPVEGLLLVRLSVRELEESAELPLPTRCFEVLGQDRQIRSLTGVYGGDLAGVALLSHYVIDMDSVRDWANELRERRRIIRDDGGAQLRDPLPENVATLEPAAVHWRLTALAPEGDEDLDAAVLDLIRWHERAHLVDSFWFLPVESNLWRTLGLLFRHGFSRASVEAEMETRAETAALALSPHTHLVLAHLGVFLEGEATEDPHGFGFRRLARRLADKLEAAGRDPRASRWHLLEPQEARRFGRQLLDEQW